MAKIPNNDFNEQELTITIGKHDEELISVKKRLDSLEEKFKPEKIADIIEEASKDSKKLDKIFSKLFCEMMYKDDDVKKTVSEHIKIADRSIVFSTLKKWGLFATYGILYVLGILTTAMINFFFNK